MPRRSQKKRPIPPRPLGAESASAVDAAFGGGPRGLVAGGLVPRHRLGPGDQRTQIVEITAHGDQRTRLHEHVPREAASTGPASTGTLVNAGLGGSAGRPGGDRDRPLPGLAFQVGYKSSALVCTCRCFETEIASVSKSEQVLDLTRQAGLGWSVPGILPHMASRGST